MLAFTHLLTGILIGIACAALINDRRAIPFCAAGALIPDLIDKPMGSLIYAGTIDNGRIFGHSLLFLAALALTGVLLWQKRGNPLILPAVTGVASHLVLDSMWRIPATLFWPFLGPFSAGKGEDFIAVKLIAELSSVTEWICFGISGVLVATIIWAPLPTLKLFSRIKRLSRRVKQKRRVFQPSPSHSSARL